VGIKFNFLTFWADEGIVTSQQNKMDFLRDHSMSGTASLFNRVLRFRNRPNSSNLAQIWVFYKLRYSIPNLSEKEGGMTCRQEASNSPRPPNLTLPSLQKLANNIIPLESSTLNLAHCLSRKQLHHAQVLNAQACSTVLTSNYLIPLFPSFQTQHQTIQR
jgi:hypothetical protein